MTPYRLTPSVQSQSFVVVSHTVVPQSAAREGLQYMEAAPWLALWPGLCLTIVVYCLNMFGDALRGMLSREGMPLRWMQWPTG